MDKYRGKCGTFTSLRLEVSLDQPSITSVGQIINITYRVFNTGSTVICGKLIIANQQGQRRTSYKARIERGEFEDFTFAYTVTALDVANGFVVFNDKALFKVCKDKYVCSDIIITRIESNSVFLDVQIEQFYDTQLNTVTVIATIDNSNPQSLSQALNSVLTLVLPPEAMSIAVSPVLLPNTVSVNGQNITFSVPVLPLGQTSSFTFTYTPGIVPFVYNINAMLNSPNNINPVTMFSSVLFIN